MSVPETAAPATPHAPSRWLRLWRRRAADAALHAPVHVPRATRNPTATLRQWHQRAGLFAALIMCWLGISGILINQSASWGYDTLRVESSWIMALYGLAPEPPTAGFAAAGRWLAVTGHYTLLDATPLAAPPREPLGLVAGGTPAEPLLFVGTPSSIVVLSGAGERLDEITPPLLPVSTIRRIGTVERGGATQVAVQDLDAFRSADGGLTWTPVDPGAVQWSRREPLPERERERLIAYSRPSVSLEHVLVDAHSGRLFGSAGAWLVNAVGLAATWLGLSGAWIWWRVRHRKR